MSLLETIDGSHTLIVEELGVTFHSKFGAIQESLHVYIKAGLRHKAETKSEIAILEMGMGTGLNVYLTAAEAAEKKLQISYVGIEAYPVSSDIWKQLNYTQKIDSQYITADFFAKIHDTKWEENVQLSANLRLLKKQSDFKTLHLDEQFDIIYFDAFPPDNQPEYWDEDMMKKMYSYLKPNGILVTYCAKGALKRMLKTIGFQLETLEGPAGKREMIRAAKTMETAV
jgi:tRNA U34 5-methylaminomethyl-2-thiouridine-forming methyltransferase MnmC